MHGTDRLSYEDFDRMKRFLINPLYRPDAKDVSLWITMGNTVFMEETFILALKCYANAIVIEPCNLDAWNNIALTFTRLGRLEEAQRCKDRMKEIKG
jgi:hypothetical protein